MSSSVGATLQWLIIAQTSCNGSSITEIEVVGPAGLTQGPLTLVNNQTTGAAYSAVTWFPSSNQTGQNIICAVATDSNSLTSLVSCYTILVGVDLPTAIAAAPTGAIATNSNYYLGKF